MVLAVASDGGELFSGEGLGDKDYFYVETYVGIEIPMAQEAPNAPWRDDR